MKTLDKEGVQYTLQRMVTLLAAIQEKVDAPYPEYKEGTWKPVLFNTDTDEVTDLLTALGFYYKIGNLVFIDGYINANNACACHHIAGLPFEPSQDNPASMYPLSIGALGADKDSTFNIFAYNLNTRNVEHLIETNLDDTRKGKTIIYYSKNIFNYFYLFFSIKYIIDM